MRKENMKWFYKILICGLMLSGLVFYFNQPAAVSETSFSNDSLIRLHVLANSDSETDQALKHKVRDEIIRVMAPEFLASKDINLARQTARTNLNRIESIARGVIKAEGKDYPVIVELDTFPFPTKHYGAFILPAGDYEAVRVVIGNGGGANWWCVLFPPLCFVDMTKNLALDTPAMSLTDNTLTPGVVLTPDTVSVKKPAQDLCSNTGTGSNKTFEADLSEEQVTENYDLNDVQTADSKVFSVESEPKVIFSFRLVEWFKML